MILLCRTSTRALSGATVGVYERRSIHSLQHASSHHCANLRSRGCRERGTRSVIVASLGSFGGTKERKDELRLQLRNLVGRAKRCCATATDADHNMSYTQTLRRSRAGITSIACVETVLTLLELRTVSVHLKVLNLLTPLQKQHTNPTSSRHALHSQLPGTLNNSTIDSTCTTGRDWVE